MSDGMKKITEVNNAVIRALNDARRSDAETNSGTPSIAPVVDVLGELTLQVARIADVLTTPTLIAEGAYAEDAPATGHARVSEVERTRRLERGISIALSIIRSNANTARAVSILEKAIEPAPAPDELVDAIHLIRLQLHADNPEQATRMIDALASALGLA